ncbi:hypothetical protein FB446DRAFT_795458 [Lentinula raphanica]|nr:hypothetical protein FB446DRAFT_795458 [Lentinula raphanica]
MKLPTLQTLSTVVLLVVSPCVRASPFPVVEDRKSSEYPTHSSAQNSLDHQEVWILRTVVDTDTGNIVTIPPSPMGIENEDPADLLMQTWSLCFGKRNCYTIGIDLKARDPELRVPSVHEHKPGCGITESVGAWVDWSNPSQKHKYNVSFKAISASTGTLPVFKEMLSILIDDGMLYTVSGTTKVKLHSLPIWDKYYQAMEKALTLGSGNVGHESSEKAK